MVPSIQVVSTQQEFPLRTREDIENFVLLYFPLNKIPSRVLCVEKLLELEVYVPSRYHKKCGSYLRAKLSSVTNGAIKITILPLHRTMKIGTWEWKEAF